MVKQSVKQMYHRREDKGGGRNISMTEGNECKRTQDSSLKQTRRRAAGERPRSPRDIGTNLTRTPERNL